MKRLTVFLSTLILMALALSACSTPGEDIGTPEAGYPFPETGIGTELPGELPDTGLGETTPEATVVVSTPAVTEPVETMVATETVVVETPVETPAGTEAPDMTATGTPGVGGQTGTLGEADTHLLSNLIGFQVVNQSGETLGRVDDFILNLCEAHILYIVVEPDAALEMVEGESVLIPYEVVSINDGQVNAEAQEIVVNLETSQLQEAPSFAEADLDLSVTDWENEVITFWSDSVSMTLTSECRVESVDLSGQPEPVGTPVATEEPTAAATVAPTVEGTPAAGTPDDDLTVVHKIAFASQVVNTELHDGNGNLLGMVEEVILTPETGKLDFIAVRLDEAVLAGSQLVLVPLRAVNIPDPGAEQINLVLLVDTNILTGAPAINNLPGDFSEGWDADAFDYWSQHVQMTREGDQ